MREVTAITDDNLIGFYTSFNFGESEKDRVHEYLWGDKGLKNKLKGLKWQSYGQDFHLILFEIYVSPIPYLRKELKEIGSYRRKEKSVGIPIILDGENFFQLNESERQKFFERTIQNKLDLLKLKVKRNKLDLHVTKLKSDINNIFI